MEERAAKKLKLSDNLLELKFMQRKQQNIRIKEEKVKALATIDDSCWQINYEDVEVGKPKFDVKYLPSYFSCTTENIATGRMSFGSFAKKIDEETAIIPMSESRTIDIQNNKRKYDDDLEIPGKFDKGKEVEITTNMDKKSPKSSRKRVSVALRNQAEGDEERGSPHKSYNHRGQYTGFMKPPE